MAKLDRYIGGGVLVATLGVLLLLVGLDALTSVIDETDDIGDGYGFLDILIYVGFTLPRRIHEFVPFAALIGALIALGRLAACRGRIDQSYGRHRVETRLTRRGVRFFSWRICCAALGATGDEPSRISPAVRVCGRWSVWRVEP